MCRIARDRLLRREALELALYSFRYLRGIDTVVSLLPPAAAQQPASAVFFRKDGVEELLKQPIREVLPRRTPPLPCEVDAKDANVTDALTVRRTFPAQFEGLPDGDAILVLQLDGG